MAIPLQYSCLENSRTEETGGLQSIGSKESDRTEQLKSNKGMQTSTAAMENSVEIS